jgi:hypothetical protein
MADAPKDGGGGSSWGPFEVVLVLILIIGILSNINNKGEVTPVATEPKKVTLAPIDDSANRCGLSVTTPISMQKTYGSVRLAGSVNGCNWKAVGDIALYAQVINGAGVPVSDFVAVPDNGGDFINTAFDTNIFINGNPSGTGYLILIPAVQPSSEKSITVRIPLKFVRN